MVSKRTTRKNVYFRPTTAGEVKKLAEIQEMNFSELVDQICWDFLVQNRREIAKLKRNAQQRKEDSSAVKFISLPEPAELESPDTSAWVDDE